MTWGIRRPKLVDEWKAVHHRLTKEQRTAELGCYMLRSTDGGVNWSALGYRVPVYSPHGPINLSDGRLLYPGKAIYGDDSVGVCEKSRRWPNVELVGQDSHATWRSIGRLSRTACSRSKQWDIDLSHSQ